MTGHWAARLRDLAEAERVPGAALAIWADGQQSLAALTRRGLSAG